MYAVVESWNVHYLGETRTQCRLCLVHSLRHGACGVEFMTDVLQVLRYVASLLAPLFWYLVADAPHHDGRMVAVVEHQILYVLVSPFLEVKGITVLAFRINPHVETLRHDHHTHRVAHLHLPCRRHVVRRADGVTTHLFHRAYLSDERRLVDSCSNRTKVVM